SMAKRRFTNSCRKVRRLATTYSHPVLVASGTSNRSTHSGSPRSRRNQMATYQPYVDVVMSRADLSYIFAETLGDITAQHIYILGGDRPEGRHVSGGL